MWQPERIDVAWIDPGYVSGQFAHSIAASVADLQYFGGFGRIHRMATSIPARGRNVLVEEFLAGESPWLWMVDSDMVFSKGHVMRLWETASEMDVKIVSGLAFIFKGGNQPIPSWFTESSGKFYPKGELHLIENKIPEVPTRVAATGLASTLVHRDVFEAMEAPRDEKWRWFDHIPLEGNTHLSGEDVQFFVRARQAGFDTVLEPRAETQHIKSIGVGRESFDRYWELRQQALGVA